MKNKPDDLTYDHYKRLCKGDEDLTDLFISLNEVIQLQENKIKQLENEIAKLKEHINKDSHNSNNPPSSDGLKKKPSTKSQRKKSGMKSGGQKGHVGKTLATNPEPDKITPLTICNCPKCGKSLVNTEVKGYDKRQVIDIEIIKYTEEYQAEIKDCPGCQTTTTASFPDNVTKRVQYGDKLKSVIAYLAVYNFIPLERLAEVCKVIFDISLSQGTIVNTVNKCSSYLLSFEQSVKEKLTNSDVIHLDESGLRIAGSLHWVHNTSNDKYTFYSPHKKRGQEAINEINILPDYKGFAIHDYWKSYLDYDCKHGLCNEHHLRELTFIHEELKQNWALKMKNLLLEIKKRTDKGKAKNKLIPKSKMIFYENKFKRIYNEGFKSNPYQITEIKKRGRKPKGKIICLLERFKYKMNETLAFMYHLNVPFDNNQAERDIRMVKVQQKVSGCFRSMQGAVNFLRIRSFISTVKKHNLNILESIEKIFKNHMIDDIIAFG